MHMDIEKLTKSQIVLLTLLVSFVTSIATGIVTVSLMEQAPPAIAQTVNRIVERTIEKVDPGTQGAAVVTTERTVVVKESELITQAVAKVSPALVRLYVGPEGNETESLVGLGVVVTKSGVIASDVAIMPGAGKVSVELQDGTIVPATVVARGTSSGVALLRGATTTSSGVMTWKAVTLSGSNPTLGQTVVALTGRTTTRITDGIVTALLSTFGSGNPANPRNIIDTNFSSGSTLAGSPLINVDGELLGISTGIGRSVAGESFIASSVIVKHINDLEK